MAFLRRAAIPAAIFALTATVYVAVLGDRADTPSPDNHYVHLAESYLAGQLGVVGNQPPGQNDWACYDTQEKGPCPMNRYRFPESQRDRYQWYVSFPPLPAVVILPVVAKWGQNTLDRLFWAIFAAFGPALLFVLLRFLRETGRSTRRVVEDVGLTLLFAFGTVYFYTAVQGTVWFAAHVVAVPLIVLYVLFSFDARKPFVAGLCLGLVFLARPTCAFLFVFFLLELYRTSRGSSVRRFSGLDWGSFFKRGLLFAAPIVVIGGIAMWMNDARFEDPFEFGHTYLQIRWRPRIERWGLFNFHYFGKNLAVFLAAMPWLSAEAPYVMVSRHGLALWFTTPNLLQVFFPKRPMDSTRIALAVAAGIVCVLNLCYQNSGWVQFGYRFALDYLVLVFVLLAMSGRRWRWGWYLLVFFSIAVNTFGAITFDRAWQFYDNDPTQNVIFQPD